MNEHPFCGRIIGVRGKNRKITNLQFQNNFEKGRKCSQFYSTIGARQLFDGNYKAAIFAGGGVGVTKGSATGNAGTFAEGICRFAVLANDAL